MKKVVLTLMMLMLCMSIAYADNTVVDYDATAGDTALRIDTAETDAEIDTTLQEVRLPLRPNPDLVKFIGDGYDYVIRTKNGTTRYSYDGTGMEENTVAPSVAESDPVGLAINYGTPDQILTVKRPDRKYDITYYGYDGSSMVSYPALSAAGLESSLSIAYIDGTDGMLNLTKTSLQHMVTTGAALAVHQTIDVEDPVAVAARDGYNIAVQTKTGILQYGYDGTDIVEIPALAVSFSDTGVTVNAPRGVAISGTDVYSLDESNVMGFEYDAVAGKMKYTTVLSVTSGLTKAAAFAVDPDNRYMVIVDETAPGTFTSRFFMHDGAGWVENTALNVAVANLNSQMDFADSAELVFKPITAASAGALMRVRAYSVVPENTKITYYVANKTGLIGGVIQPIWQPAWEIRHDAGTDERVWKYIPLGVGTYKWADYGTIDQSYPSFDAKPVDAAFDPTDLSGGAIVKTDADYLNDLWVELPDETSTGYVKAVLESLDNTATPKIVLPGPSNPIAGQSDTKIMRCEIGAKPGRVNVDVSNGLDVVDSAYYQSLFGYPPKPGWVYTTTPIISWIDDATGLPVAGQNAYQMVVLGVLDDGSRSVVLDSGKISSSASMSQIPTSYDPLIKGCLFASGTYKFEVLVRVWVGSGASEYSDVEAFKVLAMERPRISNLVDPPLSYLTAPVQDNPSTHAIIRPGVAASVLPEFKAGAEITMTIDTIGPISRWAGGAVKIGGFKLLLEDASEHNTNYISEESLRALSVDGPNNEIMCKFFTDAPVTDSPPGSILTGVFVSEGFDGIGTFLRAPTYADGLGVVAGTDYEDWRVLMHGSDGE